MLGLVAGHACIHSFIHSFVRSPVFLLMQIHIRGFFCLQRRPMLGASHNAYSDVSTEVCKPRRVFVLGWNDFI